MWHSGISCLWLLSLCRISLINLPGVWQEHLYALIVVADWVATESSQNWRMGSWLALLILLLWKILLLLLWVWEREIDTLILDWDPPCIFIFLWILQIIQSTCGCVDQWQKMWMVELFQLIKHPPETGFLLDLSEEEHDIQRKVKWKWKWSSSVVPNSLRPHGL